MTLSIARSLRTGLTESWVYDTDAWTSADLDADETYFVRAQVTGTGTLTIYTTKGADDDDIPATLRGTPNADSGGGFDTTVLDALLARVVTGAAGTVPTVTALANKARLRALMSNWVGHTTLHWSRRPYVMAIQFLIRSGGTYVPTAIRALPGERSRRYGVRPSAVGNQTSYYSFALGGEDSPTG